MEHLSNPMAGEHRTYTVRPASRTQYGVYCMTYGAEGDAWFADLDACFESEVRGADEILARLILRGST